MKQPIILLQQKSWTKCLSNSYKLIQLHQNLQISSTMSFLRKVTTSLFRLLILLPLIIKRDIITWKDCAVLVSYAHTLVDLYVCNCLLGRYLSLSLWNSSDLRQILQLYRCSLIFQFTTIVNSLRNMSFPKSEQNVSHDEHDKLHVVLLTINQAVLQQLKTVDERFQEALEMEDPDLIADLQWSICSAWMLVSMARLHTVHGWRSLG